MDTVFTLYFFLVCGCKDYLQISQDLSNSAQPSLFVSKKKKKNYRINFNEINNVAINININANS